MSTPYLGQLRAFAFNFAPKGWALCNGQTMAINQNQALFSLLGTTYGGDGVTTFLLPNLQGCVPIMSNGSFPLGAVGGEINHTLTLAEIPLHGHNLQALSSNASLAAASGNMLATLAASPYSNAAANTLLGNGTGFTGSSQGHNNMQPYLVMNYCIALSGIFPSRS